MIKKSILLLALGYAIASRVMMQGILLVAGPLRVYPDSAVDLWVLVCLIGATSISAAVCAGAHIRHAGPLTLRTAVVASLLALGISLMITMVVSGPASLISAFTYKPLQIVLVYLCKLAALPVAALSFRQINPMHARTAGGPRSEEANFPPMSWLRKSTHCLFGLIGGYVAGSMLHVCTLDVFVMLALGVPGLVIIPLIGLSAIVVAWFALGGKQLALVSFLTGAIALTFALAPLTFWMCGPSSSMH